MATEAQRRRPRTRFYDNLDPGNTAGRARLLRSRRNALRRHFQVWRHAGNAGAGHWPHWRRSRQGALETRMPELFLGITEPAAAGKTNGLRTLLEAHGIPILDHHPGIGGRYSAFTNVGLLPAMARGLDARAVRAGARESSPR